MLGKNPSTREINLVCNEYAPLRDGQTEAFIFKIIYEDSLKVYKVKIVWHDGKITSHLNLNSIKLDKKIKEYYPDHALNAIRSHNTQIISQEHAINTAKLHCAVIGNIREIVTSFVKRKLKRMEEISINQKLVNIIKVLDSAYGYMFGDGDEPASPSYDLDAATVLPKSHTEVVAVMINLNESNKTWTVFELKSLLRATINEYFLSILEDPLRPLQSSFYIEVNHPHVTLRRLDDMLTRLIAQD